jgi:hypothetical protein
VQDLRRLTLVIFCLLLALLQAAEAEVVGIATWNLEWFPGGKPTSSEAERVVHMSAAKDALLVSTLTFYAYRRFETGIALPSWYRSCQAFSHSL